MRIHCIQHVEHESPGSIASWIRENEHSLTVTHTYDSEPFPDVSDFDWLLILGGPMGTSDEKEFSWLVPEKKLIEQTIQSNKKILGICLGAQLIADVLGAKVYKNDLKEIGWHPIILTAQGRKSGLFRNFPAKEYVFQWHGDTFDLPEDAQLLATSEACKNQAFLYHQQILGLQFHLEFTISIVKQLISKSSDELGEGPYIQTKEEMLSHHRNFIQSNLSMYRLLDAFYNVK